MRHRYTSVRFCRDMSPRYPTRKVLDVKPLPSSRTASLIRLPRIRASPLPVCCMKTMWPLAARMLAVVLAAARMLTVVLAAATAGSASSVQQLGFLRGRHDSVANSGHRFHHSTRSEVAFVETAHTSAHPALLGTGGGQLCYGFMPTEATRRHGQCYSSLACTAFRVCS